MLLCSTPCPRPWRRPPVAQVRDKFAAARTALTQAQRECKDLRAELDRQCTTFWQHRLWLTLVHEKLGMSDTDPVPDPCQPPADDAPAGLGAFNAGDGAGSGEASASA